MTDNDYMSLVTGVAEFPSCFTVQNKNIFSKKKKKEKSMETLVTRELAKFTRLLTAKCPAMAYKHYDGQPRRSSLMRIKQPLLYYAMDGSGHFAADYFISNNSLLGKFTDDLLVSGSCWRPLLEVFSTTVKTRFC